MRTSLSLFAASALLATLGCSASTSPATTSDAQEVVSCSAEPAPLGPDTAEAKLAELVAATARGRELPIATFDRLEIGACATPASLTAGAARRALVDAALDRLAWRDFEDHVEVGPTREGGAELARLLSRVVGHLEERVEDGQLDPSATPELQALWQERAALEAAVAGQAGPFVEIVLETDLEECSERAVARVDLRDGSALVLRRTPRC